MKRQQPGEGGVEGGGIEQEVERAQKWGEDEQGVDAVPDSLPSLRHGMSIAGSRGAASPGANRLASVLHAGGLMAPPFRGHTRPSHSRKQ